MSNSNNSNDKIKNSLLSIIDAISNNLSDKGKTDAKTLKDKLKKVNDRNNSSTSKSSIQTADEQKDNYEQ